MEKMETIAMAREGKIARMIEAAKPKPTDHYELEKVVFGQDFWGDITEPLEEITIAKSDSIEELKEIAKTVKLKGGRYRKEELRILVLDENEEIKDYLFVERGQRPRR